MVIFCRIERLARMDIRSFQRSAISLEHSGTPRCYNGYRRKGSRTAQRETGRYWHLELHLHDFLVCADYFVACLEEHVEGQLGARVRHHGGVQFFAFPVEKSFGGGRRFLAQRFHIADGTGKDVLEVPAARDARGRPRNGRKRDGRNGEDGPWHRLNASDRWISGSCL